MLATERLAETRERLGSQVERLVPLELDKETLRLILHLGDGTNPRVVETWAGATLKWYSIHWLTVENELKVGWDNVLHHAHLEDFPHHRHVGAQASLESSGERCLEDVMRFAMGDTSQAD